MIEATTSTAGQPQVLHAPAGIIRRGDQVALLTPDDTDGNGVAGAVTAVRTGCDLMVALVVANRVHFVPADHDVVIIRDPRNTAIATETHVDDQPRGTSRTRPGDGGRRRGGGEARHGDAGHARSPAGDRHASDRTV